MRRAGSAVPSVGRAVRTTALLVAAVAVLLAVLLVASGPRRALATDAAGAPTPADLTLEVAGFEGVVAPQGRASVVVAVGNRGSRAAQDLRVRLSVHDRTRSRFALAQAIAGDAGPPRALVETRARELEAGEEAELRLRAPAADLGLEAAEPGVYPATITVLDADGVVGEFVSALVVPPEAGEPLRFATLLTFEGPVATRHDGSHAAPSIAASAERALRLARVVVVGQPTTVAVDARTVEELRDAAAGQAGIDDPDVVEQARLAVAALEELAARPEVEIVPYPYGPADLVALIRAGMAARAQHLTDRGRVAAADLAGGDAGSSVVVTARGLDAATAGWLSGISGGTVLHEEALGLSLTREMPATPPAVRTLAGIPGLPVAVPDPLLADVLERSRRSTPQALLAQRVIADSAATFFERPGASTPRGILIAPPLGHADEVLPSLAARLADASWLVPSTLSTLLEEVPADPTPETLVYTPAQRSAELPTAYLRSLDEATQRLVPLAAVLGDEATDGLERRLEGATAVAFRGEPLRGHGTALARRIADMAAQAQRAVSVVEGPLLTLTGREGTVPVTVANASDQELRVRVRVLTTRYAVEDDGGRDLVLPPRSEKTTTFEVRAHAPGGTYPVAVEVGAPAGELPLATGQVAVRSTALSIAGLAVTGGAALILLAWAAHGLIRRFGRDAPDEPPEPPPDPPEPDRPGDQRGEPAQDRAEQPSQRGGSGP